MLVTTCTDVNPNHFTIRKTLAISQTPKLTAALAIAYCRCLILWKALLPSLYTLQTLTVVQFCKTAKFILERMFLKAARISRASNAEAVTSVQKFEMEQETALSCNLIKKPCGSEEVAGNVNRNLITASKTWTKGKEIHKKCNFQMVMYAKDQQGILQFGKRITETEESLPPVQGPALTFKRLQAGFIRPAVDSYI
ncbi:hypothetical protein WISP_56528 [Willisornis vidua]|uniref:Uncharacterized protein n=1 Tax=Willisornis vidua TaxID=1566151 RepID=A0ABQ9DCT9_9PASS|nr:hypothetical protein WISP_56528 [Willisornis vidua]